MCLAAVLFITNVEFQPEEDEDGVVIIDDYPINIGQYILLISQSTLTMSVYREFSNTCSNATVSRAVVYLK